MAISCPTKSLRAWKDLVKATGSEEVSFALWAEYDGFVPEKFYTKLSQPVIEKSPDEIKSANLKYFRKQVGLAKDTINPQNSGKILKKVGLFNKSHGTNYSVSFARTTEANNYAVKITDTSRRSGEILDSKLSNSTKDLFSGENKYFQLPSDKPIAEVNKDLNDKLVQQLTELGITIESIEKFKDKYNVSPVGVSDIINGIIYVNEAESNLLTLSEETSHFIIELLGDSPLAKRLLSLVEANDYYKEILGDKLAVYGDLYDNNKDSLVREAAGKLLSQALVSKFNEQNSAIPAEQLGLMQRLWKYVKTLFNKITKQRFNKDVADAYGITADQFLKGQLSGLDRKNLTRELTMFQVSTKSLNNLKAKLENSKESIAKRINVYKRKDLKKLALREEETLGKLVEDLDNGNYLIAALNVSESARDRFKAVNKRIVDLEKSIENLELVGNEGLLALASTLRDMKSFTNSYLPMMKEIKLEMTKMLIEEQVALIVYFQAILNRALL